MTPIEETVIARINKNRYEHIFKVKIKYVSTILAHRTVRTSEFGVGVSTAHIRSFHKYFRL